jgi:hypothetical protein
MLILLADENFNNDIVRGVRRRLPQVEITTVQEEGLGGMSDPDLIEWANARGLILLTHDVNTVPGFANERLRNGKTHAGVFAVPQELAVGSVIENLILYVECSEQTEWQNQIQFLPL